MANPKRINGKALLICLLVCIAAAGIFLVGFLSQPIRPLDSISSMPPSLPPSEQQPFVSEVAAETPNATTGEPTPTSAASFSLSVWVSYLDWENGLNDLNAITEVPDSVNVFAASFQEPNTLTFPETKPEMLTNLQQISSAYPEMPVYLTIVNDVQDTNGDWNLKDSALVERLMASEESRSEHIGKIIDMVQKNGFSGVEIDYEKINDETWSNFALFCTQLYNDLSQMNIPLRVILEPGSPIEQGVLPAGPEYVMMAYNLYGEGTQPGPKADNQFISELAARMSVLPGEKCIAFATGGYEWDANGKAVQITEAKAFELSQQSSDLERDAGSGALHFTYQAEDGVHTVWYADGETLAGWFNLSRSLGYGKIALWRLGGCQPETLQMLGELKGLSQ
jgi:spore germination protein